MLIRNATVLSMDPEVGDLPRGDVRVEGSRIAAVGTDLGPVPGEDVLDATGCIVVPGFVDTHRHMWQGGLRGLAAADDLAGYFRRVLLGLAPVLSSAELALGEALSARASLDAGITTVQDTSDVHDGRPERTDAIISALQESGVRAVFCYGVSRSYLTSEGSAVPDDVRRVRTQLLPSDDALVTMGLETQHGDDDAERHNARLARELGLRPAHHVRAEILPSRLRELGALVPGTTFVHGNGLDASELAVIAEAGGSLSIAPVVEMALGLGHPMTHEALAVAGLPITLSIDVEVTSPTDMFSQMRLLYLAARAESTSYGPSVRDVLRSATLGGAESLGLGERTGSITVGKQADLLVLRADQVGVAPLADPYGAVVLQLDRAHVDTVMVGGTVHRRDGRTDRDDGPLLEQAQTMVRRLHQLGVIDRDDSPPPTGRGSGPSQPSDRIRRTQARGTTRHDLTPVSVGSALEADMSAANAVPGPRVTPRRAIPVPGTVSQAMQDVIASPYRTPAWNLRPTSVEQWKREAAGLAAPVEAALPDLRRRLGVVSEPTEFGGVPGWLIRPAHSPEHPRPRLLHVHGGGYVYWPGEAGTLEAVLMSGLTGFEIATIDYRLAHDAPFPAALDDVMAAWQALLQLREASEMAVFGTSAGGALVLSLMLRARQEGVALPAAIGVGTPWSDLTETGDTYKTNEWIDGVEVSYSGFLAHAAALYAGERDMKDPLLSPVYGDYDGLPPTILLSGTRDLFLSNTVRVHRRLREVGVDADLHVFEGQSHAQYLLASEAPEARQAYGEVAAFFHRHLAAPETTASARTVAAR